MIRSVSNIGYRNDIYFKEIGLQAQNMLTIIGFIVNIIGVGGGVGWGGQSRARQANTHHNWCNVTIGKK